MNRIINIKKILRALETVEKWPVSTDMMERCHNLERCLRDEIKKMVMEELAFQAGLRSIRRLRQHLDKQ
jgi:hypothetical protein